MLSPAWTLSWTFLSPHLYGKKINWVFSHVWVSLVLLLGGAVKLRLWLYLYCQWAPENLFPGGSVFPSLPIHLPIILVANNIDFRDERLTEDSLPVFSRVPERFTFCGSLKGPKERFNTDGLKPSLKLLLHTAPVLSNLWLSCGDFSGSLITCSLFWHSEPCCLLFPKWTSTRMTLLLRGV